MIPSGSCHTILCGHCLWCSLAPSVATAAVTADVATYSLHRACDPLWHLLTLESIPIRVRIMNFFPSRRPQTPKPLFKPRLFLIVFKSNQSSHETPLIQTSSLTSWLLPLFLAPNRGAVVRFLPHTTFKSHCRLADLPPLSLSLSRSLRAPQLVTEKPHASRFAASARLLATSTRRSARTNANEPARSPTFRLSHSSRSPL